MPLRLLLAEDHTLVRQAIARMLSADRDFQVVGEARNGVEAVEMAKELQPDAILMDHYMPSLDGLAATRIIKRDVPHAQVVILSASAKEEDLVEAVQAGARGYITKSIDATSFIKQLKEVLAGRVALSDDMVSKLVSGLASNGQPRRDPSQVLFATLSPREREVLSLIGQGKTNKEIAQDLVLSPHTVRAHVRGLMEKLDFDNRTQLAVFGVREGLIGGAKDHDEAAS